MRHYSVGVISCANSFDLHETPYTSITALTIDHVDGGGTKHRQEIGGPGKLYRWLRDENYPTGFQVLCANCQQLKLIKNGESKKSLTQRH